MCCFCYRNEYFSCDRVRQGITKACMVVPGLTYDRGVEIALRHLETMRAATARWMIKLTDEHHKIAQKTTLCRLVGWVLLKVFRRLFSTIIVDEKRVAEVKERCTVNVRVHDSIKETLIEPFTSHLYATAQKSFGLCVYHVDFRISLRAACDACGEWRESQSQWTRLHTAAIGRFFHSPTHGCRRVRCACKVSTSLLRLVLFLGLSAHATWLSSQSAYIERCSRVNSEQRLYLQV